MPRVTASATCWRAGDALVNFYLVADGSDLALVDAGLPGHWGQLTAALDGLGRSVGDIRAVLVSHGHPDHFGLAERLRQAAGAEVWVHALDAPILAAPRQAGRWWRPERSLLRNLRFGPSAVRGPLHLLRHGALGLRAVGHARSAQHGQTLDVPGRPRVIHVPGHTAGSAAFLFKNHSLLFTGDALVTADTVVGRVGPRLLCRASDRGPELCQPPARGGLVGRSSGSNLFRLLLDSAPRCVDRRTRGIRGPSIRDPLRV